MERPSGFTIVELIAGFAIFAILAAIATPAFAAYLRDCRQRATLGALVHALDAARAVAGAIGRPVRICGSSDGVECAGSRDWSQGLLLSGPDASNRRFTPLGATRLIQTIRVNRDFLEFSPLTRFATPATITVCDDRGPAAARAVIVSRTGRARLSERDPSGRRLVCP